LPMLAVMPVLIDANSVITGFAQTGADIMRGSAKTPPAYRKHKRSGRAVVTLSGKDIYLGKYGSQASHDEYDRVTGEWLAKVASCQIRKQLSDQDLINYATTIRDKVREMNA